MNIQTISKSKKIFFFLADSLLNEKKKSVISHLV
jgi:hypothetical protein